MALPKVGDGYQVGDGNLNEELDVGRSSQQIAVGGTGATVKVAASTGKVGFYGTTPITQRTAAIATSAVGTASSADVTTALKAAVLDIMATLDALGLAKAA